MRNRKSDWSVLAGFVVWVPVCLNAPVTPGWQIVTTVAGMVAIIFAVTVVELTVEREP